MIRVRNRHTIAGTLLVLLSLAAGPGCGVGRPGAADEPVMLSQIEELRSSEALLPLAPDSIFRQYRRYDPRTFYAEFTPRIEAVRKLMDSMNLGLDALTTLDTLAIDHTLENFGTAAKTHRTLYLSSSYFFSFDDPSVVRSAVTHEYGHIHYERLGAARQVRIRELWTTLRASALLYIFRDGEYSGNARFGGHPEDSPEELFASAFNLFRNRPEEVESRLRYVDPRHLPLVRELQRMVDGAGRKESAF
jgi:hypothetical protein